MNKTLRTFVILLVTLLLAMPVFAGGAKEAPKAAVEKAKEAVKIQLAHNSSLESPWQKASLKFADTVNTKSAGAYKVEVFGNGVLHQRKWEVMLEMVQSGAIQVGIESVTALASQVPEIGAMGLPFLFNNQEHVVKFLEQRAPVWKKWLYEGFEGKGMVVLAISPRPFRQLNNNKRMIKTLADIEGLKFRVPNNPLFVKIFEAIGAKPVPLPSGEIYTSIQLGTVVGEDNSISVQYDFKTHEVAKNFTIWNYIADASIVFMNKAAYYKMAKADQDLFQQAGKEWEAVNLKEDGDAVIKARVEMEKAGVKFYEMTEADKAPFKERLKVVYSDFAKNAKPDEWKAFQDAVAAAAK
jgi:tripartite ATP-independent transporter DctP family solute receptor